jgi:Carbon-nitrogen hydrolase
VPDSREDLLRSLESLRPPTAAASLVLLWTYYEPRLGRVENALRQTGIQVVRPSALPYGQLTPALLAAAIARLRAVVTSGVEFDQLALALVKSLDRTLHDLSIEKLESVEPAGIDGRRYRVRRRNNFIADSYDFEGKPPVARQGHSMTAYARRTVLIPVDRIGPFRIETCRLDRGAAYLGNRALKERQALRVMLWPFSVDIDYPERDALSSARPPEFVSLRDPRNEGALWEEIERALDEARDQKVTVLIFPELSVPPALMARIQSVLAARGRHGHPMLTLCGLCHVRQGNGLDVNEAVLLGPDGTELHRHRKLTAFTAGDEYACGERVLTGETVTVIYSAFGNLATLICLDLFHPVVRPAIERSQANVLMVPSLSPKTSAHLTAGGVFAAHQLASTFVCNRWMSGDASAAASFYRVPRKAQHTVHHKAGSPYLLFELGGA